MSEWKSMFQCDTCGHVSGWRYDRVCGGCGEMKDKRQFGGYEGWTRVAARWVSTEKWWKPWTWNSGYWKVKGNDQQ